LDALLIKPLFRRHSWVGLALLAVRLRFGIDGLAASLRAESLEATVGGFTLGSEGLFR